MEKIPPDDIQVEKISPDDIQVGKKSLENEKREVQMCIEDALADI